MWGIPDTYLSLEEYWDYVQVDEAFGYGIRNYPDLIANSGCGDYWDQRERHFLATAIAKAEKRMEADRWLGFPLRRKYEKQRKLMYNWPIYLGKYVRGCGVETLSDATNVALTLSVLGVISDPVTFIVAVTFTDVDELVVCYPGQTKYTIRPSSVSISAGTATVSIPRVRLLKSAYFKNYNDVTDRPSYTVDANFLDNVDVRRNYLDETTGCNLVWHRQACDTVRCCSNVTVCNPSDPCGEVLQLACAYVRDQRNGLVQLEPATYSGGWSKSDYAVKRWPDMVQMNYMRGYYDRYDDMDEDIVRAVIAIAHNNYVSDPCFKCGIQQMYFSKDTQPLEPAVSLGLGPSTWGIYEATQIIREFDAKYQSHHGGML